MKIFLIAVCPKACASFISLYFQLHRSHNSALCRSRALKGKRSNLLLLINFSRFLFYFRVSNLLICSRFLARLLLKKIYCLMFDYDDVLPQLQHLFSVGYLIWVWWFSFLCDLCFLEFNCSTPPSFCDFSCNQFEEVVLLYPENLRSWYSAKYCGFFYWELLILWTNVLSLPFFSAWFWIYAKILFVFLQEKKNRGLRRTSTEARVEKLIF